MRQIEVDFDVHKLIEAERLSFDEQPNEALRRLLGLPSHTGDSKIEITQLATAHRSWSDQKLGIDLPHGTKLRMTYNRRTYEGEVLNGEWVIEGRKFSSPSGAASGIALTKQGGKTSLDGWIYWQVKRPKDRNWAPIRTLARD